jgi:hypothetical protein
MIVDDFDFVRIAIFPAKTNAPLLIDSNTMLAFAVTTEGFEMIARRDFQRFELCDASNESKFIKGSLLNVSREFAGKSTAE